MYVVETCDWSVMFMFRYVKALLPSVLSVSIILIILFSCDWRDRSLNLVVSIVSKITDVDDAGWALTVIQIYTEMDNSQENHCSSDTAGYIF